VRRGEIEPHSLLHLIVTHFSTRSIPRRIQPSAKGSGVRQSMPSAIRVLIGGD
jgi:hypothetical protein